MGMSFLGDLGAEIVRVESYPRDGRGGGAGGAQAQATANLPRGYDRNSSYHMANRNKLGIAVNVMDPRGREVFHKLVSVSDAFIIGFSSGTIKSMGLDYETLVQHKPDLIMLGMPAWGERGPYEGYVTWGSGPDGWTGHHYLRGYPDLDASRTQGSFHADAIVAATMPFAILSALHARDRTGKGQFIDFSMAELIMNHLARPAMDWVMNNRIQKPIGNVDPDTAPNGCYPCSGPDSWVTIVVRTDAQWQGLKAALGNPQWAQDSRFDSVSGRIQAREEIDEHLRGWTRQRLPAAAVGLLQEHGVAAGAVLPAHETIDDPHLTARGYYRWVTHPLVESYRRPGPLWNMKGTPSEFPTANQHARRAQLQGAVRAARH
jgi:crotonobetainyl-CoA:carnitine CoA-transferase CaiB-like acyl-CoA transferase